MPSNLAHYNASNLSTGPVVSTKRGRGRLDRTISKAMGTSLREVRAQIAQGQVFVDGELALAINQQVDQFSHIQAGATTLQRQTPVYLMLNKPKGVVSATRDKQHQTVMDLIDHPKKDMLHIVGRLDFNSTGLMLLTNNGHWSRSISSPLSKQPKIYRVTMRDPVSEECIEAFAKGMYFAYENSTTLPAKVRRITDREVDVILIEGKYHQIKRMFGRFNNEVLSLHRTAVGELKLDSMLAVGEYRDLTGAELSVLSTVFDLIRKPQ